MATEDFPQADKLIQVGKVAEAVKNGLVHDSEIEDYIGLSSDDRQGRYYRKAAELLGLIKTHQNVSSLTDAGINYASLGNAKDKRDFLAKALTETELFRIVTHHVAKEEPNEAELRNFIISLYPGAYNTGKRRASTVVAYVKEAGLATLSGGRYRAAAAAGAVLVEKKTETAPLFGKPVRKDPLTGEPESAKSTYQLEIDSAKTDRANLIHHQLVVGKANFLESRELEAVQNPLIDLCSKDKGATVIYEMKSLSDTNFVAQIRKAVSQLYEYRYVFTLTDAKLCVVTNREPTKTEAWYLDYLQRDRELAYVWTDDFAKFRCASASGALLGPFAP